MTWHPTLRDDQASGWEAVTCDLCGHVVRVRRNPRLIPDMDAHEQTHNPAWRPTQ